MPHRTEQEIMRNWKCIDHPLVSVCCTSYNHESYIKDAIEGFLMQETDFPFEVIIHDDASTDMTAEIVGEYAKQYPQIIKPILQRENQYSKGMEILTNFVWPKAQGDFIALCEGDDYWTDPQKIQKQVKFLEENPCFVACYHNCFVLGKNNIASKYKYPECKENIYTLDHYLKGVLPGQTATSFFRNFYKSNIFDLSLIKKITPPQPGDRTLVFLLVSHGQVFCFQEKMSVYRHIRDEGDSFSAKTLRMDKRERALFSEEYLNLLCQMRNYAYSYMSNIAAIQTIESIYIYFLLRHCLIMKTWSSFHDLKKGLVESRNKARVIIYCSNNLMKTIIRKIITLPRLIISTKD